MRYTVSMYHLSTLQSLVKVILESDRESDLGAKAKLAVEPK